VRYVSSSSARSKSLAGTAAVEVSRPESAAALGKMPAIQRIEVRLGRTTGQLFEEAYALERAWMALLQDVAAEAELQRVSTVDPTK
jgi:hypothetical protein